MTCNIFAIHGAFLKSTSKFSNLLSGGGNGGGNVPDAGWKNYNQQTGDLVRELMFKLSSLDGILDVLSSEDKPNISFVAKNSFAENELLEIGICFIVFFVVFFVVFFLLI